MLFAQKKGLQAHKKLNANPMQKNKSVFLFVMLFIPMLHWAIFWLYVNSSSIFLAFQTRQGGWTLDNFTVFFDSLTRAGQDMNIAVKNTLLYFGVNVLICLPSSYIVAYFIYKKIAAYPVFRVIFYLPGIVSAIVLTMVFKQFIMPDGPLDVMLQKMFGVALPRAGLLGCRFPRCRLPRRGASGNGIFCWSWSGVIRLLRRYPAAPIRWHCCISCRKTGSGPWRGCAAFLRKERGREPLSDGPPAIRKRNRRPPGTS